MCKIKKKKFKKRWIRVDEVAKKVLIYASDPSQLGAEEDVAETDLSLKETTLQWELETASSPSFKLINKGTVYLVELDTPKGLFDLMFHIHRTWEDVTESSPFHLGKWLDRMGFPGGSLGCRYEQDQRVLRRRRKVCCDARRSQLYPPPHRLSQWLGGRGLSSSRV